MAAKLVLVKKSGSFKKLSLPDKLVTLGRDRHCDFCIPNQRVSRKHCQIDNRSDKIILQDLNSKAGTLVNGNSVTKTEIVSGDIIVIGPITIRLEVNKPKPKPEPKSKPIAAPLPAADLDSDETHIEGLTPEILSKNDSTFDELLNDFPDSDLSSTDERQALLDEFDDQLDDETDATLDL